MTGDLPDLRAVMNFVRSLRRNNNRAWFEAHRLQYDGARAEFEAYVALLIAALGKTEPLGALEPRDCIFRMNRDLRFSKDKTPYKPYMSAYIAPGGRKSRRLGYYVHLESGDHSMLAGGLHEPDPKQIQAWRAAIDRDPRPFRRLAKAPSFRANFGEVRGESVKTAPAGYPKDHPDIDLIRLKQVVVWREVPDRQVESTRMLHETLSTFRAMRPFLDYLRGLN